MINVKMKKPQAFSFKTWDSRKQRLTFGFSSLKSKVPVGNNADYIKSKSHKTSSKYIYAKIFGFSQKSNDGIDVGRNRRQAR